MTEKQKTEERAIIKCVRPGSIVLGAGKFPINYFKCAANVKYPADSGYYYIKKEMRKSSNGK